MDRDDPLMCGQYREAVRRQWRRTCGLCGLGLILLGTGGQAVATTVVVSDTLLPRISLRIGSTGTTIDTVTFNLSPEEVGNNIAVTGTPSIEIEVIAQATPADSRLAVLTVDSETNLSNGTWQRQFNQIDWVASDGDIPSGTFDTSTSQVLMSVFNSRKVTTTHTFKWKNTVVSAHGQFTGQVTYTVTMP